MSNIAAMRPGSDAVSGSAGAPTAYSCAPERGGGARSADSGYDEAMNSTFRTINVTLPVPSDGQKSDESIGAELRLLWLVEQVRVHRLGVGKAAELAELPRAEFMQLLGAHGVPVIDYPVEDFERELSALGLG